MQTNDKQVFTFELLSDSAKIKAIEQFTPDFFDKDFDTMGIADRKAVINSITLTIRDGNYKFSKEGELI